MIVQIKICDSCQVVFSGNEHLHNIVENRLQSQKYTTVGIECPFCGQKYYGTFCQVDESIHNIRIEIDGYKPGMIEIPYIKGSFTNHDGQILTFPLFDDDKEVIDMYSQMEQKFVVEVIKLQGISMKVIHIFKASMNHKYYANKYCIGNVVSAGFVSRREWTNKYIANGYSQSLDLYSLEGDTELVHNRLINGWLFFDKPNLINGYYKK